MLYGMVCCKERRLYRLIIRVITFEVTQSASAVEIRPHLEARILHFCLQPYYQRAKISVRTCTAQVYRNNYLFLFMKQQSGWYIEPSKCLRVTG